MDQAPPSVFRPGENVWRVERAARAALLVDGAAIYGAMRQALRRARRTIFIVGWDIDSRTRLLGTDCTPDDGLPAALGDFLSALAAQRPELEINLLLWDYSVFYALEREPFPSLSLDWKTPPRVRLVLDDEVPVGSSHHQKIVVVDDAVAFSGGLDLTIRRWDTSEHRLHHPDRVDPAGAPYPPFHDVQAVVDGAAARALSELVRARWARASADLPQEALPDALHDAWPESVSPDFRDVAVGIARTQPLYEDLEEVREVERLYADMIDRAERTIYVENQFLTSLFIAERLAHALRRRPALEAVFISPQQYGSWIEMRTMRSGRARFMRVLEDAGVAARVRLFYPEVREGDESAATMIHSKVCIVDDRVLRVGSANLNNRSMGADTECDLAFEARSAEERRQVAALRDRLLGEHCGVDPGAFAAALARTGSLIRAAEETTRNGHHLRPVDDGAAEPDESLPTLAEIADPPRPLPVAFGVDPDSTRFTRMQVSTVVKLALVLGVLIALPLAWHSTPLAKVANPDTIRGALEGVANAPWAPFAVVAGFVVAGFVMFPVVVLIAVTAAAFGPWQGLAYAAAGSVASALVGFSIGAWLGKDMLRNLLGPRLDRIRRHIVKQGVLAVATIRLVPLAPFTVVNLVAGASGVRVQDFVLGTILGLLPGLLVMSALGFQVLQIVTEPTVGNVALLGAAVVAWIGVSVALQWWVTKRRGPAA